MYSNKNEAPPTHVRNHSSVTSKNIFNEKHLRHRIRGIPARRHKNVHTACLGGRALGVTAAAGQGPGPWDMLLRVGGSGVLRGTARVPPHAAEEARPPPHPAQAGSVLLRPAASGYQNHNKNKHKLKDNCQAGEDDDNHLSTFCVPTIYAVTLATVRSVKRGPA